MLTPFNKLKVNELIGANMQRAAELFKYNKENKHNI